MHIACEDKVGIVSDRDAPNERERAVAVRGDHEPLWVGATRGDEEADLDRPGRVRDVDDADAVRIRRDVLEVSDDDVVVRRVEAVACSLNSILRRKAPDLPR